MHIRRTVFLQDLSKALNLYQEHLYDNVWHYYKDYISQLSNMMDKDLKCYGSLDVIKCKNRLVMSEQYHNHNIVLRKLFLA